MLCSNWSTQRVDDQIAADMEGCSEGTFFKIQIRLFLIFTFNERFIFVIGI